jgi:hypothetical protein
MNVALSAQEIDDTEAIYLQDILVDTPGLARRRGPVAKPINWAAIPRPASGLAIAIDPSGQDKYAALTGTDAAGYLSVWSTDHSAITDISWPHVLPTEPGVSSTRRYRMHQAAPAQGGGTWIGTASDYSSTSVPLHALGLWYGGAKADYTTGTISFTRGSATVTGSGTSWVGNVEPGMFLFANTDDAGAGTFTSTFIGVVLSVNSNTSITLESASPYSGSAGRAYSLTSVRGFIPKVNKGRITCATDSTTVSGGSTKFSSQGLGTGTWNLYRASDFTWIGKVASVQSNISLTLSANAAIALADEQYIAIRGDWATADKSVDLTGSSNKVGWLTAIYAERQWYANNGVSFDKTYRLWFSDTADKEAVDLSGDGDWIPISSTSDIPEPIRALVPTYNALLVMKESETFAVYGTSPSSFSAKKLADDGTLSTMSAQSYGGGAIWAGRGGIYFYDGVSVQNLIEGKLGDVWRNSVFTVDPLRYRMWSMLAQDHYILHIEDLDPTISVVKGNTSSTPTYWVVAINMNTKAFSMMTGLRLRGAVTLPASAGRGVYYVVNGLNVDAAASNLGKTAAGGTAKQLSADYAYAVHVTPSEDGITNKVKWRLDGGGTGSGDAQFRAALYSDSGGEPSELLEYSDPVTVTDTATASDVTFTLRSDVKLVSGTKYWIALFGDSNADSCRAFADTVSSKSRSVADTFSDGVPATWDTAGDATGNDDLTAYVVYDTRRGHLCDANDLFDAEGIDTVMAEGDPKGPDFYFASKKFNAGNDVQLKRFKQVAIHYLAQGGAMKVDAVLGLNNVGQTLTSDFPSTVLTWDALRALLPNWSSVAEQYPSWSNLIEGVFRPKRVRFLKKDHHFSFRLWQEVPTMTRLKVGPFHIVYKLMRPQRVQ